LRKIAVIGAGGHSRSSINILLHYFDRKIVGIYDDSFIKGEKFELINSIPLIGRIEDIQSNQDVFLSVGDNTSREKYFLKFKEKIIKNCIFHPTSIQEKDASIGISNQFFASTFVGSKVKIGFNNIINTGAIVEHESVVGNHNHISIGAVICGRSSIGNMCLIGAGAVVMDKLSICDNTIVGAGSVVIRDINDPGTYVGNPARRIK